MRKVKRRIAAVRYEGLHRRRETVDFFFHLLAKGSQSVVCNSGHLRSGARSLFATRVLPKSEMVSRTAWTRGAKSGEEDSRPAFGNWWSERRGWEEVVVVVVVGSTQWNIFEGVSQSKEPTLCLVG